MGRGQRGQTSAVISSPRSSPEHKDLLSGGSHSVSSEGLIAGYRFVDNWLQDGANSSFPKNILQLSLEAHSILLPVITGSMMMMMLSPVQTYKHNCNICAAHSGT